MNTDKLLIELANYMDEKQNKKQQNILDELSDCQNPSEKYADFSEHIQDKKVFNQIVNTLQPLSEEALEPIENAVVDLIQKQNQQEHTLSSFKQKLYDLVNSMFYKLLNKKLAAGMGTAFASVFFIALFNWPGSLSEEVLYQMEIYGDNQVFRGKQESQEQIKKFYKNNQMTIVLRPEENVSDTATCQFYLRYREQLIEIEAQTMRAESGAFKSFLNLESLNLTQSDQYTLVAIISQTAEKPSLHQIQSELDKTTFNNDWKVIQQDFQYVNL